MEQFDLNQVRNYVRLVQAGSFTKAAEVLKQPKSRVSRHLAALEKELGLQLVYRTTRQFQLTEVGRAFYERARGLVEGLEALSSELVENTSEVSGLIKITAADDVGVRQLPAVLDEFSKLYPQVRFELLLSQSYVDLVKESVDVAIRIGTLKDSSLRVRRIGTVKNIFVATPGLLERYRQWDDLSSLESLPFIGMTSYPKIEFWRSGDLKKFSIKPKMIFTANNPTFQVQMALLGKGVTFVPEFLVQEHLQSGRLVHIHKNMRGNEVPISLVMPEQKEVSLKVKKFSEFAIKKLKELFAS